MGLCIVFYLYSLLFSIGSVDLFVCECECVCVDQLLPMIIPVILLLLCYMIIILILHYASVTFQHRVTAGLFQSRVLSCKCCSDFVFLNVFLHWILVGVICGITRVSMCNLLGYFECWAIRYYKVEFGIYSIPVIYVIFTYALCICYYFGPVKNFVLRVLPSMQNFRSIASYREIITITVFILCLSVSPLLFLFCYTVVTLVYSYKLGLLLPVSFHGVTEISCILQFLLLD